MLLLATAVIFSASTFYAMDIEMSTDFRLDTIPIEIVNKHVVPQLPLRSQAALVCTNNYFSEKTILYTRKTIDLLINIIKGCRCALTEDHIRKYNSIILRMQAKTIDLIAIRIADTTHETNATFMRIACAYGLKDLTVVNGDFNNKSLLPVLPLLQNNALRSLSLEGTFRINIDDLCTSLRSNRNLTHLSLRDNFLGTTFDGADISKILSAITEAKTVTHLTLEGYSASKNTLVELCNNTTLEILFLDSCGIGNPATESLLTFMRNNKKLEILSIPHPRFNKENTDRLKTCIYQPKQYFSLRDYEY